MKKITSKMHIGQRIKQIRNSLDLTQETFCNAINLEINNLSRIENGKSNPSIKTLQKIIETFNIEPNELFNISFYNNEEMVNKLTFEYYNKLPFSKKVLILKMIMLINEEDKM